MASNRNESHIIPSDDPIADSNTSESTSSTPAHSVHHDHHGHQGLTYSSPTLVFPSHGTNGFNAAQALLSATASHGNSGVSSGFSLPASNPFNDSNIPKNPFSPVGTPSETPMATPPGSPIAELQKLTLGVERYARAIEDPGPMGSFSGTVPLPSLSQADPIASRRRPSHILLDALSSSKLANEPKKSDSSPIVDEHGESSGRSTGINLSSIKRAISGKRRMQDLNMADLESNHNYNSAEKDGYTVNDLASPFTTQNLPSNADAQAALLDSLAYVPQPLLLPAMSSVTQEGFNAGRISGHDETRQRLEQNRNHLASTAISPVVPLTSDQYDAADPTASSGVRRRKPKGGILSQLLKLQRHEAAAAAAASGSSSKRQSGLGQHAQVKKTRKGFYYRSSKNNSLVDLSPSVTTTPKVSPRNSRIFDDPHSNSPTITRLPTQPSTTINNPNLPSSRPDHPENIREMEALSAATTAARLTASLGIHHDIAEILTRQSFLIMMAKALILYGAPSHRIEETCSLLARKMDIDASFALLPGLMTISFSDPETHTSDTRHLRCTQGMDMYKLSKVYTIAIGVLHGKGVEEANKALEKVTAEPGYYPIWVTVMAWMSCSAFVAPLAFNGSWMDTALAGLCGLLVGLLGVVAAKFPVYGNVFEVTSSILVGFIAKAFGDRVCFSAVSLAGVVVLLPGLLLTQAIMEMASRNIVSGAVRMFYALMYAFFLGFGLTLGAEIWEYIGGKEMLSEAACNRALNPWWYFLVFPLVSASINIVFNAHPRQWLGMTLVTAVGFTVSYFMKAGPQVTPAVAAFAVGIAGQAYGRITGNLSYVPLLSGVLLLVPGSVGVRGVLAIIGSDPSQGFQFALQMVNISVSITLGVFCSSLVWYPFWRKSTFMNF
ncbi:hypothetical protein BGX27_009466 [Mortierella sp. AM989]|nr:hypothetical protein BGX27_009466 [Mortierella sp. AM989]